MNKGLLSTILLTVLLASLAIGCSKGDSKNPLTPSENDRIPTEEITANIPDDFPAGSIAPMMFGIYEVELNPKELTGSVHPLRASSVLGDSLHVDITPFLNVSPCSSCVKIKSIAMTVDGYYELTFLTRHPFQPDKRYDLHVFDMRGILVIGDNTQQYDKVRVDFDGDSTYETPARANVNLLVNADGYTSFYHGVLESHIGRIFDSNICPYKNLWVNPATVAPDSNYDPAAQFGFSDVLNPKGHNVFPMGSTFDNPLASATYQLDLSNTGNISFLFILEASYGQSAIRATRKQPRYFLPEFHRKDPWEVRASLIINELKAKKAASTATLQVQVKDWQAGVAPTSGWDFHTSNLSTIKFKSDVKNVVIDIPGVLTNPITTDLVGKTSGTGTNDDPYTWEFVIHNDKAALEGTYYGLVAVRDDLEGTPNAPFGVSGSGMVPVPIHDITTYQAFPVFIQYANEFPVADIQAAPNPVRVCKNVTLSVGPTCLDPDGSIVKYEYDYDYDGITFTADSTQNQGEPSFGQPVIFQYLAPQAGSRTAAQRVTDDADDSTIGTVIIQVNANQAPAVVLQDDDADNDVTVCDKVTFQPGAGTTDLDGAITKYEYDWSYDGTNFTPDVTQNQGAADFGLPVQRLFPNPGNTPITIIAALRVTDDGCPDLTNIAQTSFTVRPIVGTLIYENFESTSGGSIPSGWGITGHSGGAYYLNTAGWACTDTAWRWGTTVNAGMCEAGESHFLNETGANHPTTDPDDTYQNRGEVVYTPEFIVPPSGATVSVRHNYNMMYATLSGLPEYLDGGRVVISLDNPGTVDWDDFCNTWEVDWDNHPLRPLARVSGPVFKNMSIWVVESHPLITMQADAGSSGGWTTSTYTIPNTYACQKVRLGFLYASDDPMLTYLTPPPASYYNDCSEYLTGPGAAALTHGFGWRINWVQVTAN